ncbi:MAG: response regulator [Myxococcales bacterium]
MLVVDDNRELADDLAEILAGEGIDVLVCYSAAEALALSNGKRYDVAILDIAMPEMNGVELASLLLAEARTDRCIFMTGYARSAQVTRAQELSSLPVLEKPLNIPGMLATISAQA